MQATSLILYMYAVSCLALLYILSYVVKLPTTFDHTESHASFFLRLGAIIFGLGSVIFFSLDSASHTVNYQCIGLLRTLTGFVTIIFFALQVFLEKLFFYPIFTILR